MKNLQEGAPCRIWYWCPDYSSPVGGVRILYRHVDILNDHGFSASILHRHRGFRCSWFENNTRISWLSKVEFGEHDVIVIPETYASLYEESSTRSKARKKFLKVFNTPARKIIFNQNTYNTFGTYSLGDPDPGGIYLDSGVVAAMVVSEDNRQYLQYAYDKIPIYRIHNSINPDLFFSGGRKKTQIAFMPRKNSDHALQVVALLRVRGVLDDFDVVPIENRTERETASILRESLIFLSFGYPEGISLPPAEAMACGSIVIGYHGMGGREYFRPEYCYPVEMGDILSFAKTVEDVVEIYKKEPRVIEEKRLKASAFIREEYSQDREKSDVLNAWSEIIRRCERKHSLHESHEKGF